MSAPSEMRCRLMPVSFMTTKVMARTSGMAMATTMPGTPAERQEAHPQHDGDGLDQRLDELTDGLLDDVRLVRDEMRLDADRQGRGQAWRAVP